MCLKLRNLLFHTLIPAVLAVMLLPMTAFAQRTPCVATIPVEVQVSGSDVPSDARYKLVLEPVTQGAPMPEVTELTVSGGEKAGFGPISYTVPNDYQYRLYQKSEEKDHFTYDRKVYTVTVRIVNGNDGELNAEIWGVTDETGAQKASSFVFGNTYAKPSTPGGKPGSGGGGGSSSGGRKTGDGLTNITDAETPLGGMITDMIPDSLVPLAGLPKTGDATNLALWILLMAVSGCGLVMSVVFRRRTCEA